MNPRSARGAPPDGCRSRPENAEGRFPQRHFGESGPGPLWEGTGNSSVLKGSRKRFGAGLQRGRPLRVFSSSVVFGLVRIILTRRFVRCKVGIGFPVIFFRQIIPRVLRRSPLSQQPSRVNSRGSGIAVAWETPSAASTSFRTAQPFSLHSLMTFCARASLLSELVAGQAGHSCSYPIETSVGPSELCYSCSSLM